VEQDGRPPEGYYTLRTAQAALAAIPPTSTFYSPAEVHALVRAAANEQDGAIYLSAAFTGVRPGELVAFRWRDMDFEADTIRVRASYTNGALTTPKSGKVRSVR